MENNNNSEQKELIADVINVVINRLDAEFEKRLKKVTTQKPKNF